jgi:hypothetical protein
MKLLKRLLLTALILLGLPILFIFLFASGRKDEVVVPVSEALSDGFEAIVIDNNNEVQVNHLGKCIKIIDDGGSPFLKGDLSKIEKSIIINRKALHNFSQDYQYPFVNLKVQNLSDNKQKIDYSVHYSNRTFRYSYYSSKLGIEPIFYSHSDLSGEDKRIYQKE